MSRRRREAVPWCPRLLAAPLAMAALATASCAAPHSRTGNQGGHGEYATNGTFTMAIGQDPGNFDPYRNPGIKSYYKLAYDSLVNEQPDGTFASGLASEWKVDAKSASFSLRPGVTCSDGTPLTASQVAEDLTYAGNPANKSSLYGSQVPAVAFTAIGDDASRTVKITTKKPFGFPLNTFGVTPIICAKGLKNQKMLESASDGTGPFVLTQVVPGQSYTFAVRKGYTWGPRGASTSAPGTPAKLVLKVVANQTTTANLLLSGELNFAVITGEDRDRLTSRGLKKLDLPAPGTWLWFNHLGGRATTDARVRRALMQALDLNELIKVNTRNGRPANGLAPGTPNPCRPDGIAGSLPKHGVAAAERLLDEAGWTKGNGGTRAKGGKPLELNLHYLASFSPLEKPTAELIAERWKAIGIKVDLSGDTDAKFAEIVYKSGDFDTFMTALGANIPEAAVKYVSGPPVPKGNNLSGIDNERYDTLVAKAQAMIPPASCAYWRQAEQALYENVDIAPLTLRYSSYFLQKAEAAAVTYATPIPTSIRVLK